MNSNINEVVIIGSGPAGWTAAIYSARSDLKPVIITGLEVGGQMTITTDVENYPGFAETIQGPQLMQDMEKQALKFGTKAINQKVVKVDFSKAPFNLELEDGEKIKTKSVIISTGAYAKWLNCKGEEKFKGHGVSACATCDAFFFRNKTVAVIGGGNTAMEEALHLTKFAEKVFIIHRRDQLRGEKILQKRVKSNDKISFIWNSTVKEMMGSENPLSLEALKLLSKTNNNETTLKVDGAFVAIGHAPATEIFKGQIKLNEQNYIVTEKGNSRTSVEGVFAAGDVADPVYRQAVTAAGFGCIAALDVERYLEELNSQ